MIEERRNGRGAPQRRELSEWRGESPISCECLASAEPVETIWRPYDGFDGVR